MKIRDIEISSPERLIYAADGITKLDVLSYYDSVCDLMFKEIKDRPVSLLRCHDNIDKGCFFKKHPSGEKASAFTYNGEKYFYIHSPKDIIYHVQMGTIEFHTWGCHARNINRPDNMVFDFDPDKRLPHKTLIRAVKNLKNILDELGLQSNLKTSGGKGYHVSVPFESKMDWDEFSDFSFKIASLLESKWPNLYTTNIRLDKRGGKIFVDYLRNKKGASCVAPYSLRARPHCPLSLPISWDKIDDIKPDEVTIKNYTRYLGEQGQELSS